MKPSGIEGIENMRAYLLLLHTLSQRQQKRIKQAAEDNISKLYALLREDIK